ncbi:TIGR03943 family putative permease subunit [Lyngbya sp. CCY1209]|uniref:TIGR03943 family putative permease subunit n=1 Tax=Lyngbya sp. CCY1209 TaxID=2886103 RepID=UPI002D2137F9|nr:TIGR03943 family protein [Lyngbya sp. CCY1209]MEB3883600.1 TIGR03943 family protein [Lyngbya sp. CCY1209]
MNRIRSPLTSVLSRLQLWLDSPWLDALAIAAWGFLLLKYWITGKLNILIHPNYFGLTIFGGVGLLILGGFRAWELWQNSRKNPELAARQSLDHITLFPQGWSTALLLIAALMGLLITPRTFGSHTALQRGLTESLPVTRLEPQEFRTAAKPEERGLIEWVRLLNVNPEPDTYKGQKVDVTGFVIYPPSLPKNYIWISRFVITCCAADAYPVGLPVLLPDNNRAPYPQDSWLQVEGEMTTQVLNNERRLTIKALRLTPIPEPRNPYEY